jgi:hypothetical protein
MGIGFWGSKVAAARMKAAGGKQDGPSFRQDDGKTEDGKIVPNTQNLKPKT